LSNKPARSASLAPRGDALDEVSDAVVEKTARVGAMGDAVDRMKEGAL
jgi:hypothetical protein